MRSRKYFKDEPLVFLSTGKATEIDLQSKILPAVDRHGDSEQKSLESILRKTPFFLIPGPGIQKTTKPKKMNLNFSVQSNSIDTSAPKLGVMSIYDLKPWDSEKALESDDKHKKEKLRNLTYKEAMKILESSTKSNKLQIENNGKVERKSSMVNFSLKDLGKRLKTLNIPQLKEIFRFSRHNQKPTIDNTVQKVPELVFDETNDNTIQKGTENIFDEIQDKIVQKVPEIILDETHDKFVQKVPKTLFDDKIVQKSPKTVFDEKRMVSKAARKENKDVSDMDHLSWSDFQKQIIELSRDTFTIIKNNNI